MTIQTRSGATYDPTVNWHRLPDGMTLHETPGVAVAADDTVYLLTRNTANPVIVLTRNGEFVRTFGAGTFSNRTHAILAAHDGFIYCADDGAHTITKWTPEGELLMTIGTPGKEAPKFSGKPFNRPTDMVVASDGSLFISDGYGNARVHHYSPAGELLKSWGEPGIDPGQFMVPHNIGIDASDRLYVADREALRVQVFSAEGELLDVWQNVHRPCALTVGPDGNVYVGELNAVPLMEGAPGMGHRVSVFDPSGRLLTRFGDPEEGEHAGQFIAPHGIAVDSRGDVYVGEVSFTIRGSRMEPPRDLKSLSKLRKL
ncbi:MAG: peptidyl-alpha-hydroxyglycine alpha-amidating lyase family protein [Chloroflexi bacterium]|nr:peptidyl-alpha-hydroxyglycine alpha-amidating lyase family protein [Chloroflexota bacterium]MDA1003858.1 peptidyl-alpha-hydroxyglycine alpha-amidating lyase family protein [Chloroflexota bacterium]